MTPSARLATIQTDGGKLEFKEGSAAYKVFQSLPTASDQALWGVEGQSSAGSTDWVRHGALTQAVTYANNLASGTACIQLQSDVNITAALKFARDKTTVLDLNGKTVKSTELVRVITVIGNLTLTDTSTDAATAPGKITGGKAFNDYGGGVYVAATGSFTMNGGAITGNLAKLIGREKGSGGGVYVDGAFTMNGGSITDNQTNINGGGVYVAGTFTMNGGSITGNSANHETLKSVAGGVYVEGTFIVGGSSVIQNNVQGQAGTTANNVYLPTGKTITVAGALTEGASIGVITETASTAANPISITSENNADYSNYFTSDKGFAVINVGTGSTQVVTLAQLLDITQFAATNGSFTVQVNGTAVTSVAKGQIITVTPTPNSGYELDSVKISKTSDNSEVTATVGWNDTTKTFTMPDYAVTVTVTFKAETPKPPSGGGGGSSSGGGGSSSSGGGGGSYISPVKNEVDSGKNVTASDLNTLANDNKTLTVTGQNGEKLVLDSSTIKALAKDGGKLTVTVSDGKDKLNEQQTAQVGNNTVYDLSATLDGKTITSFGGKVTVSLPYTLKDGEKVEDVKV